MASGAPIRRILTCKPPLSPAFTFCMKLTELRACTGLSGTTRAMELCGFRIQEILVARERFKKQGSPTGKFTTGSLEKTCRKGVLREELSGPAPSLDSRDMWPRRSGTLLRAATAEHAQTAPTR